jgi:hypothetical protein
MGELGRRLHRSTSPLENKKVLLLTFLTKIQRLKIGGRVTLNPGNNLAGWNFNTFNGKAGKLYQNVHIEEMFSFRRNKK